MTVEPLDPRFVVARRALLNALLALAPHRSAIVVAGAQAIYLRTGDADFAITPFTIDGDVAINPSLLGADPRLEAAMRQANFELTVRESGHEEPGIWVTPVIIDGKPDFVSVDLIVPEAVAPGRGRRAARLPGHGDRSTRRLVGLEGALVDHSPMLISSLDAGDTRSVTTEVAGPAALLVAKAHKIRDRVEAGRPGRIKDKDASDIVRLMQTTSPGELACVFATLLADQVSSEATQQGLRYLRELFGRRGRRGIAMASNALRLAMDRDTVEVICTTYITRLDDALGTSEPT
ncbi:MAG: hypothetical protein M0Z69_11015 [Actinomycetota bacterium]|nr:hypothetical protein [Actinomycetota bacterium]